MSVSVSVAAVEVWEARSDVLGFRAAVRVGAGRAAAGASAAAGAGAVELPGGFWKEALRGQRKKPIYGVSTR